MPYSYFIECKKILKSLLQYIKNLRRQKLNVNPSALSLPTGCSLEQLHAYLASVRLEGAPPQEMANYLADSFLRFLYTLSLVPDGSGNLLEIGANPYFTTLLVRKFRHYSLFLANYFGESGKNGTQMVWVTDPDSGCQEPVQLSYEHFSCEQGPFPYPDSLFEVVLCCEVIEHLLIDPIRCMQEIKRVLRPGGTLIVTTPNVARLENVLRLIAGANLYDPYSGYGPYGRHNREYNRHELVKLLEHVGFSVPQHFTADVHQFVPVYDIDKVLPLLEFRGADLGQYLFFRAIRNDSALSDLKRPSWLYRSYPADSLI